MTAVQDGVASAGGIEVVARRPWRGVSLNVSRQATERNNYPMIWNELMGRDLNKWMSSGHLAHSCRKVLVLALNGKV